MKWLGPGGGYAPVIDNVFRCPMVGFNVGSKFIYVPPNDQDDYEDCEYEPYTNPEYEHDLVVNSP